MNDLSEFLAFRKMLTPIIIQIIFWIGVVVCVIGGIVGIVVGAVGDSAMNVLTGILTFLLGSLFVRVYCELLIVFFRMNDSLKEIKSKISGGEPQ